jgi:hypothetical protein
MPERKSVGGIEVWAENGVVEWKKTTAMQKRSGARFVDVMTWAFNVESAREVGRMLIEAAAEAALQRIEAAEVPSDG